MDDGKHRIIHACAGHEREQTADQEGRYGRFPDTRHDLAVGCQGERGEEDGEERAQTKREAAFVDQASQSAADGRSEDVFLAHLKEDGDEEGSFQVGVSVTEQVDDDNTTQLVYFGCASLLDEATDQQVSGGNTDLVLAVLGWMCENDAPVIDVTSKSLTMSYLTVPQFDAAYWSIIVIWFKRRKQ